MAHDPLTRELKDKLCYQEDQIYRLREKLVTYDKVISKKEELECQLNELKQWLEDVQFKEKKINTDLLNNLECQSKKLKQSEAAECQLRAEKNKLLDLNDCMTEQIRTLTQNEQKLQNSIEELMICKNRLQCELTDANTQIDEQNCSIEKLAKTLRCKEEEFCEMRRQLEECQTAFNRLSETYECQEKELECLKAELVQLKADACKMEERLKCERDSLSTKLEIKCQRFREIEIEHDEIRRNLCDEKATVCKVETQMEDMRLAYEKEKCEMIAKMEKLRTENCMKDESTCRMKAQIADLSRENECKCAEINELKTKVLANECLLEKIQHSSEVFSQMKNNKVEQLERDKSVLECELKQKKRVICEMEQEACRLKSSINSQCQTDREVHKPCDKVKELEATTNTCDSPPCPVSVCGTSCTRETSCSNGSYCPLARENPFCGCTEDQKCKDPSSCSFIRMIKGSTTKTCNKNNNNQYVLTELKQLYSDLEQLKSTTNALKKC